MEIVDFTAAHVQSARRIALLNYRVEQRQVTALPTIDGVPDLAWAAENGLGVAALEAGDLVGFIGSVSPFASAFGSTDAVGVFSPMGANGAVGADRARVYARMLQAACAKWARAGAASHALCLHAHDLEVQMQLFRYGFGMRCVDAIRDMGEVAAPNCPGYRFDELRPEEWSEIWPLHGQLGEHMADSPTFIRRAEGTEQNFVRDAARSGARFFAARQGGESTAYLRAERKGETFLCELPGYFHVTGAYCLPRCRGRGLLPNLLGALVASLRRGGITRLGVDFESINPAAYGFWLKHFTAYTVGVVRRIDEHAVAKNA